MEELLLPTFEKIGMIVVGVWTPEVGGSTNALTYLLGRESMATRKFCRPFFDDPRWKSELRRHMDEFGGTLIAGSEAWS